MNVSEIARYFYELEEKGFTGSVTLNFHEGNISNKIEKKVSEKIKE